MDAGTRAICATLWVSFPVDLFGSYPRRFCIRHSMPACTSSVSYTTSLLTSILLYGVAASDHPELQRSLFFPPPRHGQYGKAPHHLHRFPDDHHARFSTCRAEICENLGRKFEPEELAFLKREWLFPEIEVAG